MPELQKRPLPVEVATSDTASIQRRRWQRDEKNAIVDQVEPRLLGGEDNRMDIEAWLQGLGLERYVPAFRDNEIDWEVLPKLTSDDLREIGVAAIGHRRKLLDAIATLGASATAATLTAPVSDASASAEAERRQLTVMFCDLVGSTALSVRFDPEDLREIIGAYHRCVTDTVGRFGGFVAKYMGDGVLIYFGYPEAHEDDPERAARAGLAVIDAVGQLTAPEPLNVRLGVASGLVVVGDLIGAGAAQERGVVGETPNLAARLQALAQPGALERADQIASLSPFATRNATFFDALLALIRISSPVAGFRPLRARRAGRIRTCRTPRLGMRILLPFFRTRPMSATKPVNISIACFLGMS